MSPVARVLLGLLTVLGLVVAPVGTAAGTPSTDAPVTAPPDPPQDRLGWENGYWWNESVDVTAEDGLNRSELTPVLARTMARVEYLRRLEFTETPDVKFITRSRYRDYVGNAFARANISDADRLHQNVKFEALFLVGERTDYYDVAAQNQGGFAAAFYTSEGIEELNLSAGSIAMIVGEDGVAKFNMPTFAHELVHALQDQQFGLGTVESRYNVRTEEDNRAYLGVIEGDASYVQGLYRSSCGLEFECLSIESADTGRPNFADIGAVVYQLVPYRNGPDLIRRLEEREGWSAVNALYRDKPIRSTEQYIHPDKYRTDPPTNVTIEDRSTEAWSIPDLKGGVDYASFGEAGIFTMLWAPGSLRTIPQSFDDEASSGWDGDKLYPYVRNDSLATGETGYVWKIVWDTPEDAQEFASAYREKLGYYGAREAVNAEDVYVIDDEDFGDAFALRVNGTATVIVNAPTLDALNEIRAGVVPEDARTPAPTATATPTPTETATTVTPTTTTESTTAPRTETTGTTTTASTPGFTVSVAVLALAVAALLARRRR